MKLDMPGTDSAVDAKGTLSTQLVAFLTKLRNNVVWRSRSGTTAKRPTDGVEIGTPYFDTTLNMPIWAKTVPGSGAAITWVRYDGTAV